MIGKSLQEWYKHTNGVYWDKNFYRSPTSICCHLIEVCGGLSAAVSPRRKRDLDPQVFLPKAIAWWLALCGRVGVPSVENMLWAKFPRVCPYCQKESHKSSKCKEGKDGRKTVDWETLDEIGKKKSRPRSLAEWQNMFNDIYERDENTDHKLNVYRLSEELGELCEAVRTLTVAPGYFLSEAPDVFAWLMGFANQFDFDARREVGNQLETDMEREYPATCRKCGHQVCKCPPIHPETLGRIAKEVPREIADRGRLFSLQESIALFRRSHEEISVNDQAIQINSEELKQIREDVGRILKSFDKISDLHSDALVKIVASLGGIQKLANQGEVTQSSIDELKEILLNLPSEKRSLVLGFINNLAASGTFLALSKVLNP